MREEKAGPQEDWSSMNLAERIARLNPRRQEIVRPAIEDPQPFILLSVRDMANKLGTDPATIVRIAKGLGFASYKEFQRYLHELSVTRATSLVMMQSGPSEDSIHSRLQRSLDQEIKNLRGLYNSIDLERITAVANRLWKARRILLLGGDLATSLVFYFEYHLNLLGMPVTQATMPGVAAHIVRSMGEGDLVLGISFRRGLRMTVEGIQQARKQGAYCVGLTDTYVSPIAQFSDEFFLASVEMSSFGPSYAAPIAVMNLLLLACAEVRRPRILDLLKKVDKEQRLGFRWYEL
ncbi:MAG: MurR/RpiR family transcriptional regulator [Acidobacteria bacterium]|nr:MurR/RpiR family transcriptional regulator [Acidobacteriota bacterium]